MGARMVTCVFCGGYVEDDVCTVCGREYEEDALSAELGFSPDSSEGDRGHDNMLDEFDT